MHVVMLHVVLSKSERLWGKLIEFAVERLQFKVRCCNCDTVGPTILERYKFWNDSFLAVIHSMFLEHDSISKYLSIVSTSSHP